MYGHDAEIPRPSLYKVLPYFVIEYMVCEHTASHPHQVTEEQIKLDLTDPSIMPTTDCYNKLVTIAIDPMRR